MSKICFIIFLTFSFLTACTSISKKEVKIQKILKTKPIKKISQQQKIDPNFIPSLSDTLNTTNKLKNKIQRQLARKLDKSSHKKSLQKFKNINSPKRKTKFGDVEIGFSHRKEEALTKFKKN